MSTIEPLVLFSFETWTEDMGSTVPNQGTLGSSSDGGMDSNYTEVVSLYRGTRYLEITGTGETT